MKDYSRDSLEMSRPDVDTLDALQFCLNQLYNSKTKCIADNVCERLTYEELIGALLLARDTIQISRRES